MSFLTPWSALFAAVVALPLLVLLYLLKLRRQHLWIPSTLLWRKSFEDLQVNAPFQRLRWSLLLLLQALLLVLLLLALAQPMLPGDVGTGSRIVLIIDRSASMNTVISVDADGQPRTRLDEARDRAREAVSDLAHSSTSAQMMLLTFGSSAQVLTTYSSDRRTLLEAIDQVVPTDEPGNLDAVLQLAAAFGATDETAESAPPQVVLFSDGGVGMPSGTSLGQGGFSLRSGVFRFVRIGAASDASQEDLESTSDNLGIAAFSARREYDDPTKVLVFARLVNASPRAIETVATLTVDGAAPVLIRKTVPGASTAGPGDEPVTTTLNLPEGAVLSLTHNDPDALAADNVAHLVLPAPAKPRVALVYPDADPAAPEKGHANAFLEELLAALEPQTLQVLTRTAYETIDSAEIDSGAKFDLIVFDRINGAKLPGVPSLTVGGVPLGVQARPAEKEGGKYILSWDRQHPLMRQVALDPVVYANFGAFELPTGATPIAFGADGPIIAVIGTRGARHVLVGFSLEPEDTNWPIHVSAPVFMQNVYDYLTLGAEGQTNHGLVFQPGQPISVRASAGSAALQVERFGGTSEEPVLEIPIGGGAGAVMTLPALRRIGLYRVQGAAKPMDLLAVSLLSDLESDNRVRADVSVSSTGTRAGQAGPEGTRPVWPWLVGAALALLVVEWLVYCRRAR